MVRFFSATAAVAVLPKGDGPLPRGTKLQFQHGVSTLQLAHLSANLTASSSSSFASAASREGPDVVSVLLKVQGEDDAVPRVFQVANFVVDGSRGVNSVPRVRLDQRFTTENVELLAIARGATTSGSVTVTGALVLNGDEAY